MPKGHVAPRELACRACAEFFVTDLCGKAAWRCPACRAAGADVRFTPKPASPVAACEPDVAEQLEAPSYKRCLVCRDLYRLAGSVHWCSAACLELLRVSDELLVRIQRLASEGVDVLLDVDLRPQKQRRFVVVTTTRGRWDGTVRKNETWEQAVERVLSR